VTLNRKIIAQSCSAPLEAMTAKYWQYRDNFNKHFILNDRDSSGCVGDGIGHWYIPASNWPKKFHLITSWFINECGANAKIGKNS
jgi:hypothetical protein